MPPKNVFWALKPQNLYMGLSHTTTTKRLLFMSEGQPK